MNEQLIAASRQALKALEASGLRWPNIVEAITSLRTAIKAAEKQQALDKKAENERELGIQMQPKPFNHTQAAHDALRSAMKRSSSIAPAAPVQEPRCAVIVEVFEEGLVVDYMSLPVGKHKLYTQQYIYTTSPAAPVQEPLTGREQQIIMFAVHRFMSDAYAQSTEAAQDHDNRYFKSGASQAFYKDAKDAEALIAKLRERNGGNT